MRETTIARSYAEALFELGQRHGESEDYATAFHELVGLYDREPIVRLFLLTPKVEPEEKKRVLDTALEGRVPPLFLNFVKVVIDKRRQRLLDLIAREYDAILDESLGRLHVQVTLARDPDERMEEDIRAELTRVLGRKVVPHIQVDPAILGGVIARYGDKVLDGSLRRRLRSMRRRLLEAQLPGS